MNCTIGTHQKQLRSLALLSVLTALMFSACTWAQTQSTLLDQGIYAEDSLGDLDKAIELYEQILADVEANRAYAAQAQYRLGVCYTKKGLEKDAAAAFRKVVDRYSDQATLGPGPCPPYETGVWDQWRNFGHGSPTDMGVVCGYDR